MQKTSRRNEEKPTKAQDQTNPSKKPDNNNLSTPRTYVQKSSTTDIYGQKKKTPNAPKKIASSTTNKTSPMSSLLKSSASTASVKSVGEKPKSNKKVDGNIKNSSSTANKLKSSSSTASVKSVLEKPKKVSENTKTGKTLPFSNVTVTTPPTRRKLELSRQNSQIISTKETLKEKVPKTKMAEKNAGKSQQVKDHQRQKTRTLTDDEVKVLTPEIDNNAEMRNLLKLKAEPKAFFIDLEGDKTKNLRAPKPASPSPDVSYEDDFESYESDFESYHSDKTSADENKTCSDGETRTNSDDEARTNSDDEARTRTNSPSEKEIERVDRREVKDEERMLDSGNFDLERRSATRPPMANIIETTEFPDPDLKISLPDEGFQEMSSSSGARSHVEVFERPLFIDFEKSKSLKKKRLISQKMQQRAKDILSMIKLHEMSYSLFEMQPIPYDLYMVTYGRQNYTQTSAQTFDDGVTEEIQTDDIDYETKWTQHPVKFSNFEHHFNDDTMKRDATEDFLNKFTFLFQATEKAITKDVNKSDERNNLKVFLEQKDGVGDDKRMSETAFEKKLTETDHNSERLNKFLKKSERRITNILNQNSDKTVTGLKKSSFPFSKGYNTLYNKNSSDIKFLKNKPITGIIVSKQNSSFIITIHNSNSMKSIACLWDITTTKPLKILTAIDSIIFSLFNGKSDGIFISALNDGTVHLWDLSEEPMMAQETPKLDIKVSKTNTEGMTQSEIDREWNMKYSHIVADPSLFLLQACAYTSSAVSIENRDVHDSIVGMDFIDDKFYRLDGGRKIIGQICTLQRTGIVTTWLIVQNKQTKDLGKAYWSKMKLEKNYEIKLIEHIDPITDTFEVNFNLTASKKRLSVKKCAKNSRANSAVKSRPSTARRVKVPSDWESGVLCSDIKVMNYERVDCIMIAKNCGEVWCCRRVAGAVKMQRFCVSSEKSTITLLQTASNGLPYFLAATDAGTIHLFSLKESRVLLTLDSRNMIPESVEKYSGDHKGRYIGTVPVKPVEFDQSRDSVLKISSLSWSPTNPCRVIARTSTDVAIWDLTRSDIYATKAMKKCESLGYTSDGDVLLLTSDREVQVHRQNTEASSKINIDIFNKYVTLL